MTAYTDPAVTYIAERDEYRVSFRDRFGTRSSVGVVRYGPSGVATFLPDGWYYADAAQAALQAVEAKGA